MCIYIYLCIYIYIYISHIALSPFHAPHGPHGSTSMPPGPGRRSKAQAPGESLNDAGYIKIWCFTQLYMDIPDTIMTICVIEMVMNGGWLMTLLFQHYDIDAEN